MNDFRERMHPAQARMEIAVAIDLQRLGYNISMSEHYRLKLPPNPFIQHPEVETFPDITLLDYDLLNYFDGWQVHHKREIRDEFLRKLLTEQYPVRVLVFHYKRYSEKMRKQIVEEIVEGAPIAVS